MLRFHRQKGFDFFQLFLSLSLSLSDSSSNLSLSFFRFVRVHTFTRVHIARTYCNVTPPGDCFFFAWNHIQKGNRTPKIFFSVQIYIRVGNRNKSNVNIWRKNIRNFLVFIFFKIPQVTHSLQRRERWRHTAVIVMKQKKILKRWKR